ncbi:MAG: glycosyltransferase [Oscillospiraceae bacterium]
MNIEQTASTAAEKMGGVCMVIPCLQPNEKFLKLLQNLRQSQRAPLAIVVVDDGSGEAYAPVFERAKAEYGCTVLTHAVNLGKGRALKTAFNYILAALPGCSGAVTADADGQHAPEDVFACIQALEQAPKALCWEAGILTAAEFPFTTGPATKLPAWC